MPEESFEQQARNMAELFSMEPQPHVWQRVKAAIAPKRRRRAVFVWWMLGLGLVCGLGFWLMNNSKLKQKKEANAKQHISVKTNLQKNKKSGKADEAVHGNSYKEATKNNQQNNATVQKKGTDLFLQKNPFANNKMPIKQKINTILFQPETQIVFNKKGTEEKAAKPNPDSIVKPSQTDVLANKEEADVKNKTLHEPQTIANDTTKINREIVAKTNDTLSKAKDSSIAINNKKRSKRKWHWGVTAEGGTSWLGNGLFGNGAKSLADFSSDPTGMTNGGSQFFSTSSQRRNGVDVALGILAKTNFSKHWFLDGALIYRYQQFSVQSTTQSSGTNNVGASIAKSNTSYRFQSANLYAGIGLFLFHKKDASVALQAGMDNGWLLSIKQKHNDSLQSLTAQGFVHWQPSLQFSVPVGIYTKGNVRWQISPFVRWGLGGLQKNDESFAHHPLNATGIKANYFFK